MVADLDRIREHFAGDEELIEELVEVFEVSYLDVLSRLDQAIKRDAREDVKLEAHTLKGMISNFFAEDLRATAFEIESRAAKMPQEDLHKKVMYLKEKIPTLINEIKDANFN